MSDELIEVYHPEQGANEDGVVQTATVTRQAFDELWKAKGFVIGNPNVAPLPVLDGGGDGDVESWVNQAPDDDD